MNFEISYNDENRNSNLATLFYSNDESFRISLSGKCLNSLNNLNQELVNLGFNSIYLNEEFNFSSESLVSIDFNSLILTITEFTRRYRTQLPILDKLQEKCHRLDKDNELHLKREIQLKEMNETQKKEIKNYEEKCRQFQMKLNNLNKLIKDDQDEIRKLKSFIDQRETFYKHDRKKVDNEIFKLKEKLQQFITNKTQLYANIDISETLNRNSAKQRATWNSDSSKKQIDIYTHLIKDYENRLNGTLVENADIKQTVTNIVIKLSMLCKNLKNSKNTEIDENLKKNNQEFIKNLPFETICPQLDEFFKLKFSHIEELIINKKSPNFNGNDNETNLNTTFTIENDDDVNEDDDENLNENDKSISSSKSSNNKMNSSLNLTTQNEIEFYKNETNECKQIIKTQNEMINSFHQNLTISNDKSVSFIEIEANSIIEERTKLSEEKKLYYKQKLQFEEEKLRYNQAVLQLAKQRKSFEEEKELYYKTKLYDSFGRKFNLSDLKIDANSKDHSLNENKIEKY